MFSRCVLHFFLLYLRFFVVFSISTPNHLLETAAVNLLQSFRFIRVYGYENIWLVAVNLAMQAHLFWSFFPYIVSLSFHYVTTIIRCCSFPFVDHRKRSTYWPLLWIALIREMFVACTYRFFASFAILKESKSVHPDFWEATQSPNHSWSAPSLIGNCQINRAFLTNEQL